MAIPFEPLNTKKLKTYFKKFIESNCKAKDRSLSKEKSSKILRNQQFNSSKHLEAWVQRQINS